MPTNITVHITTSHNKPHTAAGYGIVMTADNGYSKTFSGACLDNRMAFKAMQSAFNCKSINNLTVFADKHMYDKADHDFVRSLKGEIDSSISGKSCFKIADNRTDKSLHEAKLLSKAELRKAVKMVSVETMVE